MASGDATSDRQDDGHNLQQCSYPDEKDMFGRYHSASRLSQDEVGIGEM
ncbi:hypothetical protein F441_11974 [Phytophthora nicotianae CJ01A1]|uniref:Uncharacterized protein n=5 Tax=Phytophthora nicotianae TaxID=4792 RepID=V9EVQ9_PHYNI|nr:hypothetical protein F443_12009 [Phytophthora nicotianae P1569]ETK82976.1 hypothetical protein L915_11723 [Phytophthora nicotianae]ETO71571.1 hypothetical protein F444_12106 [Phytophthora nicotianae P1976]ETP12687.1 hypothetical protein F441_11974 [Phytophthora nicotianae CJ01A1]ETP40791.1 hypothetical protein F442_11924 [Phytophthora nicotianae P10297]